MFQSAVATVGSPVVEQHTRPSGRARTLFLWLEAVRRFVVISAIAFWLGGFTFYAGVAVPMGVEVLGTHKAVGFVTQRVTHWLNVAGIAALSILLINLLVGWRHAGKHLRRMLLITWAVMVLVEIELFILHPVLDRMLITQPVREILDQDRFDLWHRVYLISSSFQWLCGVLHVWAICLLWGREEHGPSELAAA